MSGRGCHTGCRMNDLEGRFVLKNELIVEHKSYYWTLDESETTIIVSCNLIYFDSSFLFPMDSPIEVFINLIAFLYCPGDETEDNY